MDNYQTAIDFVYQRLYPNAQQSDSTQAKRNQIHIYLTKSCQRLDSEITSSIDIILDYERNQRPTVDVQTVAGTQTSGMVVWNGDITTLKVDAIVNAANAQGLGCFVPDHKCIDQIIHQRAGPSVRHQCQSILNGQTIKTGQAILTQAGRLPCNYIIHTVGPIHNPNISYIDRDGLARCYTSCLDMAKLNSLRHLAFCTISTGLYGFPKKAAAQIALDTVREWLSSSNGYQIVVIFCVYDDENTAIYRTLIARQ